MQKFVYRFFGGEASEIEDVAFIAGEPVVSRQWLEMGKDLNAIGGESVGDQLAANELAGSEEQIDATLIGSQPFVKVGFGGEHDGAGARAGITVLSDDVGEGALFASGAGFAVRDAVVGRAEDLEVVQVVENGDAAALEFPEDRRREMMIDAADVGDVRAKVGNALAHGRLSGARIKGVSGHADFFQKAGVGILEVDMRDPIGAAGEGGGRAVVHGEKGGLVAAPVHALDQVEKVGFCSAKRIVVLVAIQDAHNHR